ncbi:MAG: carboxypeptidase regulatory-like domain-containing protein, partial [Bryobacterales bacterium]|nr:carboxypeptidase regulatory-like domain-containing protein [Bryobacterales bacterium]
MSKRLGFSRITMLGVWLALCASLLAQDSRVVGTVTDESGAVIPGARVTATNQATNLERGFETDATGNFDIPGLQVGGYMVRAEADGFRAAQTEITLEVNQTVRQNFRLPVGSVAETVSVVAQAPLLQADSGTISQVITNRQIVELPLNGRSFTSLALLVPGVTPRGSGLSMFGESGTFSINGARPGTENYMVEGVTTNSSNTRQPQLSPSIEAIQEFSIQTSSYTAEYGRGSAAVNVITKSGNNQFRGNVYEFIRNDALAANNFFQNQLANPEDADSNLKRNQFGGTIGGPIIRDKTFFFAHYEGNRLRQGATSTYRVPTSLEMQADFSQSPGV